MREHTLFSLSERALNDRFYGRYIPYEKLENYLEGLPKKFNVSHAGNSVLGRKIYTVEIGTGPQKILMWSQMHGNESTTTKAVMDLLNLIDKYGNQSVDLGLKSMLQTCRLKIIPVLNPDGAHNYTRHNANGVDLNRDASAQTQPEMQLLQAVARDFKPDFCLNLHDQRSIFGVGQTDRPATMSFLAPASDPARNLIPSRKKTMQLIAGMNEDLQGIIPGQVGRYDDAFNPNCIGDFFQAREIPTVLFEAGHCARDYQREKTRKFVFVALCKAILLIGDKNFSGFTASAYFKIPENETSFFDVLIKNVRWDDMITDIGIQYEEKLLHETINFLPKIKKIEKLKAFHGHYEIDAEQQRITTFPNTLFKKGDIVKEIGLNDKLFALGLTNN